MAIAKLNEDEAVERCLNAYYRMMQRDSKTGVSWPQPSATACHCDGQVVSVRNSHAELARYKLGNEKVTRLKS